MTPAPDREPRAFDAPSRPPATAPGAVVVTGGGSGLGAAMGAAFAGLGLPVAVLDINEHAALDVADNLSSSYGVEAMGLRVDVASADSVRSAADHVHARFGSVRVVCSNVGVQQFGSVEHVTDEEWQWVLDVNVVGTARVVRSFLPLLRAEDSDDRSIVLTSSTTALVPRVRIGSYQASKAAVAALGATLRAELAAEGIHVLTLFPDGMTTSHLESSLAARPASLTSTGAREDDVTAMLEQAPELAQEMTTPARAIRHLLADLKAREPFTITHGTFGDHLDEALALLQHAYARAQEN